MQNLKNHNTKILAAIGLAAIVALSACNTTAGAGKDISKAGHAITNSAQENSD